MIRIELVAPVSEEFIRREINQLIEDRSIELNLLGKAVKHYQDQCPHTGQVTGSNERDGSWGNPCPICGYSY